MAANGSNTGQAAAINAAGARLSAVTLFTSRHLEPPTNAHKHTHS